MPLVRRLRPQVVLPLMVLVIATSFVPSGGTVMKLRAGGVTVEPSGLVATVPADSAARFMPSTSVLSTANLNDPAVAGLVADDRAWLAAGDVPGRNTEFGGMARRALLDLRALTLPTGAVMAAPVTSWKHVWPRDASFVAVAYTVTGHDDDAAQVLRFLGEVAPDDGRWEARYRTDGAGPPDDRVRQLDGAGWVPWAVWVFVSLASDDALVAEVVETMRRPVIASAAAIVESLGADGLPEPSSDYWEKAESKVTLGTAAPLALGLHAAIALGGDLEVDAVDLSAWSAASKRLDRAIVEQFGAHGYPRTLPDGGLDAAVAFAAPPFAPVAASIRAAVVAAEEALRVPNGGHRPGEVWEKDVDVAWTPETGLLALALAGLGEDDEAARLLTFLDDHRTALGSLPEKVDARSSPASVAPLSWTSSLVLLTLAELEGQLPVAPAS